MTKSERIEQLMLDNGCSLVLSEMLEYVKASEKDLQDFFDFEEFVKDYAFKRFGDIVFRHDMDSDLCDIFERLWDDHYLLGTYKWYDDLVEQIERGDCLFADTIVYYSNAMDWLSEHDCSLEESLEIADELGYRLKDLSSEVLANLHAERYYMDEFAGYESEINDLQDEINELYDLFDEIEEIFDEEEEQQTTETPAE